VGRRSSEPWPGVDWALAERLKALYWRDWKRQHGTAGGIRIADELRKQAVAQKPTLAHDAERRRDHRTHLSVLSALARVAARRGPRAR
jgi:hypothetical protein